MLVSGRVGKPWLRLPRAAVAAPSLEVSKDGAWSNLGQCKVSLPRGWDWMALMPWFWRITYILYPILAFLFLSDLPASQSHGHGLPTQAGFAIASHSQISVQFNCSRCILFLIYYHLRFNNDT